jgi:large subunit ribosomal protein L21
MLKYAVVEIKGRQYKIAPDQILTTNLVGEDKAFECDKVLLLNIDGKLTVGNPYLKEKLKFEVIETTRGPKIRVAKHKPKANYRRVKGSRDSYSKIKLQKA